VNGYEDVRCALAAEFPGWLIKVIEDEVGVCWDASRVLTPGHGGATGLHSDNATLLRWAMRGREIGPIGHLDGAVEHIAAVVAGSLP